MMTQKEKREFNRRLKKATDNELNSWLWEQEMTDDHRNYEDTINTIKAIRAELEKRSGVKVRKVREPRLFQEILIYQFNQSDKYAIEDCKNTTVKAINEFLKKTGWKIKRSLRKAEKIAAIFEWVNSFRKMSTAEKLEIINSGKFDKFSLLMLCKNDTLREIAKIVSVSEKTIKDHYFHNEELTLKILERLAA